MMAKAVHTRDRIIQAAIPLFNQKGYAGTTLSDIMSATGLHKGSIYACFDDKQAIAVAAFRRAVAELEARMETAIQAAGEGAADQLRGMLSVYETLVDDPAGGCPILNAAIDSDDAHPFLKAEVQMAMARWQGRIQAILEAGDLPSDLAGVIIASVEGGLMLSKLMDDKRYIQQMIAHVMSQVAESS